MSITFTEEPNHLCKVIYATWTSDSNGDASGTTTNYYDGKLISLTTIPNDSDAAPDDNYDITAVDALGIDVLLGQGMNRDTANTEYVLQASLGAVSLSKLTFAVDAAGELNGGTFAVYII